MSSADHWLRQYGEDRPQASLTVLDWLCVPVIVTGLIGLLWSLPVPRSLGMTGVLNWGTLFLMATIVYYFIVSMALAVGSLPFVALVVVVVAWLDRFAAPLWFISALAFAIAWTVQVLAYRLEGRKLRMIHDLQYLMIGPLWLLARIYRRFGIPY
jgi:hypothetical protein